MRSHKFIHFNQNENSAILGIFTYDPNYTQYELNEYVKILYQAVLEIRAEEYAYWTNEYKAYMKWYTRDNP